MIFSKNLLPLILLSLALTSSGCFKAKNNTAEEWANQNAATFTISKKVEGSSAGIRANSEWDLTNAQLYNFTVCAEDMHTQEKLKGHKFIILDADGKVIKDELRTNNEGCMSWSETVHFNPVADPKYIPWTRYVRANGIHTGQRKLNLAINPWSYLFVGKPYENVVDLSISKIDTSQIVKESEAQVYLMGQKKSKGGRLWVDGMIANISSQGATDVNNNATL